VRHGTLTSKLRGNKVVRRFVRGISESEAG